MKYLAYIVFTILLVSCGGSSKNDPPDNGIPPIQVETNWDIMIWDQGEWA